MKIVQNSLASFLLLLCFLQSKSQCNFTIGNLSDSINICKNTSITLSPSLISTGSAPTYLDTLWSPSFGLSDPNILNPLVTVGTTSTQYILTVTGITATNLIANGDFSLGNTIFSSSYVYGTGGTYGLLSSEGQYAIAVNPNLTHINFANFGDHTTGTGNMMVVNGSSTPNVNIWCQTISVIPNTDYDFSAWGATCVASNPAILQFSINGVLIGTPLALPTATGVWTPFHATWNSGSNTSISICITDQATALSGNDFAIDDIAFKQICLVKDTVNVNAINLTPAISLNTKLGCSQDTIELTANSGSGNIPSTYTWDYGDGNVSMIKDPTHIYSTQGNYIIKLVTELSGCKDSAFTTVNTLHPMNASFSLPDSACTNQMVTATNLSNATGPFLSTWEWEAGSIGNNDFYTFTNPDIYTVFLTITDVLGCTSQTSELIKIISPPMVKVSDDSELCAGDQVVLTAISNMNSVVWQDGSTGFTYTVKEPGMYTASSSNYCGTAIDTTIITAKDCNCISYIPNAFTPNGDQLNDIFHPRFYNCEFSNYDLSIYNRWGMQLYHSTNAKEGWNGKYKGIDQELGTYYYVLQFFTDYKGIEYRKGDLILIR